jgi:hypothetical protein
MPPIRTPLKERCGNRQDGKHLSPYQRGLVVGQGSQGAYVSDIAADLNLHESSIKYTLL